MEDFLGVLKHLFIWLFKYYFDCLSTWLFQSFAWKLFLKKEKCVLVPSITILLSFSKIHSKADNDIVLNKDGELILKKEEFADIFNDFFRSIVGNLNKEQWNRSSTASSISNRLNDIMVLSKVILTSLI